MKEYIVHAPTDVALAVEEYATFYGEPVKELIRCKDCKHWNRDDGTFKDFDGKEWHGCKELDAYTSASGNAPVTPLWFYCGYAERREE